MPSTNQSKDIDASISEVWAKFNNFHDLSWAPNVITNVEKVGGIDGGEVGAKRILNSAFHETLVEIEHNEYTLKYSIDDGPSPVSKEEVSNYYGVVKLSPATEGDRTHVEWSSSWESNVEDAVEFCHGIYVALLNELAESFKK
ncbi:MAG: SRPBCC family protein [bacterium]